MSAVQFHCPLCQGLFQVDDALAGIEVNCPHCSGLVTVPSFESEPPPPTGDMFQLSCPICDGEFQVPPEAGGQEVSCPHCYGSVTVPAPSGYGPPIPPPAPNEPQATTYPAKAMYFPPGAEPNPSKPKETRSKPSATAGSSPGVPDTLLPPGASDASATLDRKPLPAVIPERRKDTVLIPTEQGLVGVHSPVKTINLRGQEVELRQLTSAEKARRRAIRNGVLFVFCVIALIGVMATLKFLG